MKDESFLFLSKATFNVEGKFSVIIDKTANLSSSKEAIQALEAELLKITTKDKFQTMYFMDDFNMSHRNKMKITIESTKDVFDKCSIKGYKKEKWEPLFVDVSTYWRK